MRTTSAASRLASSPVSAASAAVFRIGFGGAGALLVVRFFAHGWINRLYIEPEFHFTYPGFGWVQPLPGPGMYLLFAGLGVSALAVAVGFRHRVFAVVFALGLAYVELIDRTLYLNHYYWMVLTGLVIAFLPLSNTWSVDSRIGPIGDTGWVPAWVVWLLRFQVGMVYVFAGVAKLNADWLARAEPLATWLPARSELWLVGSLLTLPATAFVLSWAGAVFDLTIVGWLSWRRTRAMAYVVLVAFHFTTWLLFPSIGLFPLIMSMGALVFFEPDWPRRFGATVAMSAPRAGRLSPAWTAVAALYVLAMLLVPMRHYLADSAVAWSGDGYLGSWQVMVNEKSGSAQFIVWDADDGSRWRAGPPDYLTVRQVAVMATDPALIAQTAELVSAANGGLPVSADVKMSINGRLSTQLTDPSMIIARGGETTFVTRDWVLRAPATP